MGNAPSVLAAGADAVAVIRDLLAAPDLEERARQFLAALKTRSRKSEPPAPVPSEAEG
jgi:thiamine monophosphate synthase